MAVLRLVPWDTARNHPTVARANGPFGAPESPVATACMMFFAAARRMETYFAAALAWAPAGSQAHMGGSR